MFYLPTPEAALLNSITKLRLTCLYTSFSSTLTLALTLTPSHITIKGGGPEFGAKSQRIARGCNRKILRHSTPRTPDNSRGAPIPIQTYFGEFLKVAWGKSGQNQQKLEKAMGSHLDRNFISVYSHTAVQTQVTRLRIHGY